MTAETDLPINDAVPAPTKIEPGNLFLWNWRQMQVYAQACVAHATAPLQAEIEALRAEVASAQQMTETVHEAMRIAVANEVKAEARAERLAEALREELRRWADRKADAIREQVGGLTRGDPEAIARCDAAIQRINAALEQEKGSG